VQLVLHPEARIDIVEAADWYEARAPGLGRDLISEVDAALASIAETPNSWPVWPDAPAIEPPFRRLLLSRFSMYAIGYQVIDAGRVHVLALAHGSRKPFYWVERAAG
jgi:plasmid stabilization system protein ParE